MSELQRIVGIGPGTDRALISMGISTFSDLIGADAQRLATILSGTSTNQVQGWQRRANQLLLEDQEKEPTYLVTFIHEQGRPTDIAEVDGIVFPRGKPVSTSQEMKDRLAKLDSLKFSFVKEE